jgi:hypothetical protein
LASSNASRNVIVIITPGAVSIEIVPRCLWPNASTIAVLSPAAPDKDARNSSARYAAVLDAGRWSYEMVFSDTGCTSLFGC